MNKLKQIWSNLRSSFWFAPSLIVAVSIAIAVALVEAGSIGSDQWLARWPRLFGVGAVGARGMLSTIAGSMMRINHRSPCWGVAGRQSQPGGMGISKT